MESISSHFAKHDKDARGEVDYTQFKAGLQSLGVHVGTRALAHRSRSILRCLGALVATRAPGPHRKPPS